MLTSSVVHYIIKLQRPNQLTQEQGEFMGELSVVYPALLLTC